MFKRARIKLTLWYLVIIMVVSVLFSLVIYAGINNELKRIETIQNARMERNHRVLLFLEELRQGGDFFGPTVPAPESGSEIIDIAQARFRIITILGFINVSILCFSAAAGYFLAGRTLQPIKAMVDEQKDFVSNASHELRTPLTSLKSEIEVALRDSRMKLSDAKELLKSNLEEVNKMQKLSNYLLALNKYQNGNLNLNTGEVDLERVAIGAVSKISKIARNKNIKIISTLKMVKVKGDFDSLTELLTILLENAVKYSKKGGEIRVSVGRQSGKGLIKLTDNGMGIAKEDLPHIFDRFYRADFSRSKEKIDGYGLGLSIAKSIIELNGGEIKVESAVGKGTTFKVII